MDQDFHQLLRNWSNTSGFNSPNWPPSILASANLISGPVRPLSPAVTP
jgi:hypothetical protein